MFCKWCGQTVDPSKGKCASCGRELPALSECGGFYNIMPEAKLAQVRKPAEEAAPRRAEPTPPAAPYGMQPNTMNPPANPPAARQPVSAEKKSSLVPVLGIALALCFLALVVTAVLAIHAGSELKQLSARRDREEQTDVTEKPGKPVDSIQPEGPDAPKAMSANDLIAEYEGKTLTYQYTFDPEDVRSEEDYKVGDDLAEFFRLVNQSESKESETPYGSYSLTWRLRDSVSEDGKQSSSGAYAPELKADVKIEREETKPAGGIDEFIEDPTVTFTLTPELTIKNFLGLSSDTEYSCEYRWFYSSDGEKYEELNQDNQELADQKFQLEGDNRDNLKITCAADGEEKFVNTAHFKCIMTITWSDQPEKKTFFLSADVSGMVLPGFSTEQLEETPETPAESETESETEQDPEETIGTGKNN